MTMYMFWQAEPKTHWLPALATERDTITRTKKPALVGILDVDNSFESDLTAEEARGVRYAGPFYLDFDASDLSEAITQFQLCLAKLRAKDVNLDMLRLYATGKKGFHIEVPLNCLWVKSQQQAPLLCLIFTGRWRTPTLFMWIRWISTYIRRDGVGCGVVPM